MLYTRQSEHRSMACRCLLYQRVLHPSVCQFFLHCCTGCNCNKAAKKIPSTPDMCLCKAVVTVGVARAEGWTWWQIHSLCTRGLSAVSELLTTLNCILSCPTPYSLFWSLILVESLAFSDLTLGLGDWMNTLAIGWVNRWLLLLFFLNILAITSWWADDGHMKMFKG